MVRRFRRHDMLEPTATRSLGAAVRSVSQPLAGERDLDPLLDRIGDAKYVLLGEASHGTHEYYAWRAAISRRLIEELGFRFIAVEGDWPDCFRVNSYIKAAPGVPATAREVLHAFERWPTWMWANHDVVDLTEWLRWHNDGVPNRRKAGFYGLDVYSLWESLHRVVGYLAERDPAAGAAARRALQCFEPYGEDVHEYAHATRWVDESCEDEVVALLASIQHADRLPSGDGDESRFDAEQNALVARNAEHYYRTMVRGGPESWNIRDNHMAETLARLMEFHGPDAKGIVWAHNTHVGDARYTDMTDDGMVNIGELVRMRHPTSTVLVGFGSHRGSVIAGREWEAPMQRMGVPPAREGSWEDVLHQLDGEDRLLIFDLTAEDELLEERGHRAIGVVYRPAVEQYGNYVPTVLPRRYDAFLYLDATHALDPLHEVRPRREGEVPETFPTGV